MSIASMMTDKADIYKLKSTDGGHDYGVPTQPEYYYEDVPDYKDIQCSVQKSGMQDRTERDGPFEIVTETYNLYLPKHVEIGEKDKVVFKGVSMYAGIPFSYRTHTEVKLRRDDRWREII